MAIDIEDIRRMNLKDGDTIVVQMGQRITAGTAEAVRGQMVKAFGESVKVLVIDPDTHISVMGAEG